MVEAVPVPGCPGYSFRAWEADGNLHIQVLSIDGAIFSLVVSRGSPPRCRVALCAAFPLHVPVAEWMRDFERCIAWAWLEGR